MNAKRCDRCGQYYNLYAMDIPESYKDELMKKDAKMNQVVLCRTDIKRCDGMPTGYSKPIDLCPDCMTGLLEYLNGGSPTNKKNL